MDDAVLYAALDACVADVPNLVAAWVFGSTARGTSSARSDLDVAILLRETPASSLEGLPFDLQFAIEERLGRRADVVVLNEAPVDLIHRVLRDGNLLVERERSARIRFEVRARNLYFDLLPVLREYRHVARRRTASGTRP